LASSDTIGTSAMGDCPVQPSSGCLERIALYDMLDCDQVFLLSPSPYPYALYVEAAAPAREARLRVGDIWDLGEKAARIFERPFDHSDATVEPYTLLHRYLSHADLNSWLGLPLRGQVNGEPVGVLGVAGRSVDELSTSPAMLDSVACSVTAALGRLESDIRRPGACPPAGYVGHDVERMRALTNMAFGVAHSLGNIFSAILGNLHFLGEEPQGSQSRELVEKLEASTYAGIDMMQSLQNFAAAPCCYEMQPIDLSELGREVVTLIRQVCIDTKVCPGIGLHTDLAESCPAWGSPGHIREALINIVFNAIQALRERGDITLITRAEAGYSSVSVRDNGPGMTKEVHRRATEPFFTTRPATHQGLGLSVVRGIAVGHRGQLTIQSKPGQGACVQLRVPQEAPARAQAPEQVITQVLSDL